MKYLQRFTAVCLLSLSVASAPVMAQLPATAPETPQQWDARWISGAGISPADYGVYLFRKTFSLKGYSGPFTIHLTADNRYRLYVNGRLAGMGPARSDPANWYYATTDISSYLKYGDNVIAVEVVNYGPDKPRGQFTYGTGLLVQGHTDREAAIINTGTTRWQVIEDAAFYSHPLPAGNTGFYGAFPGDSMVVSHHPHGWEQPEYDATRWDTAISTGPVALQGTSAATWRLLAPQPFGALLQRRENFTRVIKEEGIAVPPTFLQGTAPVTVPAKRKVKLLLDRGYLTTGFPELLLSGGLDATVTLTYSATTDPGSTLQDVIRPDGGARRRFTPTGYRSFRYVLLDIATGKSPLTLEDYANVYTQYNLSDKAAFAVDVIPDSIWEKGKRISLAGAQDNLYNDLSGEMLQYIEDAQIHGLAVAGFSGDDKLLRNAICQFARSRIPEGLPRLRYPSDDRLVAVRAALTWINTLRDYLLLHDDRGLAVSLYPGIRHILEWVESYTDPATGLPGILPYNNQPLAPLTFGYMYSLRQAATMAGMCGHPADSLEYVHTADKLREVIYNKCFDRDKGLYAETPGGKVFSRYTNAMAVLSQAVPPRQVKAVMQSLVAEKSAPDEPMRDKFYIFRAMQETGVTGTFLKELENWAQQADSTDTPWHYASAGVANIYLLGITAGIQPASNGFKTVLIAPEPGNLKKIHVVMPHPDGGMISVALQCNNNKVTGQVQLPFGITGKFRWKGREMVLHGGPQKVSF